jgi:hypothetical protein
MANKTIDDFTAVTVPATTDTVIVTQSSVTKKETLAQIDTLLSATTKTLTNKTLTSPVINTSVSGTAIDIDGTLTANSNTLLATQKAVKTYVDTKVTYPVVNLKPVVNASVNKLDIFTKSGGAVPDANNIISVAIPDATGFTSRSRAAAYLSGTSQIVMADGINYWSKGSHATEVKTAWLYAIWDGTGIVWALAGYSGFNVVPTTTTATDDDYFLLEGSSTYTRSASHYCVAVCKVRYQYNTADTPDHTLKATGENAPQVVWDPKSDYAKTVVLGSDYISASDIADYSAVSAVIKQSGKYIVHGYLYVYIYGTANNAALKIKIGSATYGSAVEYKYITNAFETGYSKYSIPASISAYINAGDTLHLGCTAGSTGAGNRIILSPTGLVFNRND